MNASDTLDRLHASLTSRRTPQDIAKDLVALGADGWLPADQATALTALSTRNPFFWWNDEDVAEVTVQAETGSSMPAAWYVHPGLVRAYRAATSAMAALSVSLPDADPTSPQSLQAWLAAALPVLGLGSSADNPARGSRKRTRATPASDTDDDYYSYYSYPRRPAGPRGQSAGHADPRQAMTAEQRREALPGLSVRAYRRAVRAVTHLQQRTAVLAVQRDREAAVAFGKSRLAWTLDRDAFGADPRTAAFVAYYTSRLGMRTMFTNGEQDRPMDDLADALFRAAMTNPDGTARKEVRADVLAAVLTRQSVLRRLDDEGKTALLSAYHDQLGAFARVLRATYDTHRDSEHMVVRQGDDSTTWNTASRAFNQARTGWLNLTAAMGLGELVEQSCPGKVPALVASDVAAWHVMGGGNQHADISVWAALPRPWDVLLDDALCPASLVRKVCLAAGLDADKTGWTQPYRQDGLAVTAAAPDLVHGIAVSSPALAAGLRRAGYFSGQAQPVSRRDPSLAAEALAARVAHVG